MSFLNFTVNLLCKKTRKVLSFPEIQDRSPIFKKFWAHESITKIKWRFHKKLWLIKKKHFFREIASYKVYKYSFLNIIYREKGDTFKISFSPLISFAGRCTNTLMVSSSVSMLIYQTKLSCYIFSVKSISRNYPQNIFKVFYKLYYVIFNLGGQRENTIIKILENLSNKSHI